MRTFFAGMLAAIAVPGMFWLGAEIVMSPCFDAVGDRCEQHLALEAGILLFWVALLVLVVWIVWCIGWAEWAENADG